MNTRPALTLLLVSLLTLGACDREARMSQEGFRLPEGNAQTGREAFLYMQCNQCHTIAGMELPRIPDQEPPYVELGGTTAKVKTYGELITAIINPSHKLARGYAAELVSDEGESRMYVYNEQMTVQELIDIVMFLQEQYEVVAPAYYYRTYPIR